MGAYFLVVTHQCTFLECWRTPVKHKDGLDAVKQQLTDPMKDAHEIGVGALLAVADAVQELVDPNTHIHRHHQPRTLVQIHWPLCLFQHLPQVRHSHCADSLADTAFASKKEKFGLFVGRFLWGCSLYFSATLDFKMATRKKVCRVLE